ncbi:hypothetical protein [Ktedonospora formicarum]|uniref:Uncharacterized protein n=1 Tax=Ktedonospora formicarum TaxID=2778364 RepID=A0A8J3I1K2_9CHLR|nr:hypothetical protein [Ktedonospora formicarum]GHO44557.1 hypothetical protein KSX_27200 [Ktedonospora formicarum]
MEDLQLSSEEQEELDLLGWCVQGRKLVLDMDTQPGRMAAQTFAYAIAASGHVLVGKAIIALIRKEL